MMHLRRRCSYLFVIGSCLLVSACFKREPDTFTFSVDLPPGFSYRAVVHYVPAPGETCRVAYEDNKTPAYNPRLKLGQTADYEIAIHRTVKGCPMVVWKLSLDLLAPYSDVLGDVGMDYGGVAVRNTLDPQYQSTFDANGVSHFYGECEWLFRTVGKERYLIKVLSCKESGKGGKEDPGGPFAAYTLAQLPGKTVKMNIALAAEERPYFKGTWVKFENGWKRCLGKGLDDVRGYCHGNFTDFSTFQMPDDRECTIYPGCKE